MWLDILLGKLKNVLISDNTKYNNMDEYIKTIVMISGAWLFAATVVAVVWHAMTYNRDDL